jgi:hypothetical protein
MIVQKVVNYQMSGRTYNRVKAYKADQDHVYCCLEVVAGQDPEGNDIIEHSEPHNHFPIDVEFMALNTGEKEALQGKQPREAWNVDTIKLWLDDRGIDYNSSATEAELLALA